MLERIARRIDRMEQFFGAARPSPGRSQTQTDSRVRAATADTFSWATRYTKTRNEHWMEEGRPSPYEHFPPHGYLRDLFELLEVEGERVHWFEKSRDMMVSWALVAFFTLQAMKVPSRGVLFQTQKQDKVVQLVDYAKCLYKHQPKWLRDAYPLKKPLTQQADTELHFANGSYIAGIPGGADQIRSFHPWGFLNDESSFQPEAGESFNEALAVVKGKIVFNSSAGPGWYADARRDIIRNEEN